jgi:hypothetical protein
MSDTPLCQCFNSKSDQDKLVSYVAAIHVFKKYSATVTIPDKLAFFRHYIHAYHWYSVSSIGSCWKLNMRVLFSEDILNRAGSGLGFYYITQKQEPMRA